jgi:hypothetical protein
MAVFTDLKRDTLVVLGSRLSRNKFISGYPVTGRQIAICSATRRVKTQLLLGHTANHRGSGLIFRMSFHY